MLLRVGDQMTDEEGKLTLGSADLSRATLVGG